MFQKAKDAVMAFGSSVVQKSKELYNAFINEVRDTATKAKKVFIIFLISLSLTFGFATPTLAEVPAGVTTAITSAATDVATLGGAVIIVMVGIKVWKWIQRVL